MYQKKGRLDEAEQLILKSLDLGKSAEGLTALAHIRYQRGDRKSAIKLALDAIAEDRLALNAYLLLTRCDAETGEFKKATDVLTEAAPFFPGNQEVIESLLSRLRSLQMQAKR